MRRSRATVTISLIVSRAGIERPSAERYSKLPRAPAGG